ncbi:ABC transporter related protein [Thermoanaerobacter mathranii subsp. mathranii str. A3]|uniref:ABC transporter related protein n=1 Tax=Thermoanaerobacter mathranii subsp. mathranii (strain DSM 11426 / CCUG 53645 / CIP 108742 / A3) TaxID=583358 RepID=A0ABN3YZJ6_THEM3|nr:ABC transporter ATP-binding protein [Thermoanaerobacter mathranii]ADH60072.1 ABC transporter related protein [Thermoanaerobacter mathranii subsp. mathranii str. A3]
MSTVFELKNVYYSYNKSVPALVDITFEVKKGEKLILLGANGSGKSTLLKLMDNLISPDSGEIWAFGKLLGDKKTFDEYEFRKKVGFVFQDSDVQLFSTTVFDEISFAPLQMGLERNKVQKTVEETLNSFGIEKLKDRPPHRLSGGEKKKVALASVMVINPEVLLLDEPTNGLDPRSKKWLLEKLQKLNKNGTTIVIATHDLDIAAMLSDRIIVLNENHSIEAIGKPDEILKDKELLLKVNLI